MAGRRTIRWRVMAAIAGVSLLVAPLDAPLGAQSSQPQAQQSPAAPINPRQGPAPPPASKPLPGGKATIRSTVSLVEIDVQVTNRDGKPVKGLKQEQFTVTEDGKAQKISSFEYNDIEQVETAGKGDEAPITVPLGAVTSPEEIKAVVRDHRMIVLFFDLTSLQADDLLRSTRAAQKYLQEQMTPADFVGVVAFGNTLKVVANFTNDRGLLKQAVDALVPGHEAALSQMADAASAANGETAVTEDTGAAFTADDTEFNIFNTDRKLAAVEALCEVLEGIPGKKSIIQFTSGITQTGEENRSELIAATNAANRSNVSIYSVDSRGLLTATPGGDASTGASSGTGMFSGATVISQSQSRQDSRDTLATLAGDTGGRTFFDVGDFGKVFQSVQNDTSGYYLVGYYSTNGANDGAWRRIHVKIDALPAGANVRAREGYYAAKNFGIFTTEDRERQLENAFQSDTPEVELPLAVETSEFRLERQSGVRAHLRETRAQRSAMGAKTRQPGNGIRFCGGSARCKIEPRGGRAARHHHGENRPGTFPGNAAAFAGLPGRHHTCAGRVQTEISGARKRVRPDRHIRAETFAWLRRNSIACS